MPNMIVVNVPPYEGEYELSGFAFSTLEWRWIKKIGGYMPLTWDEGWRGGDPDLMLALAVIAMHRAGKIEKREALEVAAVIENAPVDGQSITVKLEEEPEAEEAEADPTPPSSPDDSRPDSGDASEAPTELSPENTTPSGTGSPSSETTTDSAPLTLAK